MKTYEKKEIKLPWIRSCGPNIALTAIIVFKIIENKNENLYSFETLWVKAYYHSKANVINFNRKQLFLLIGLNEGVIKIFKTSKESNYSNYSKLRKCEGNHKNKITGLEYDEKKGYIYSCGKDNRFLMTNINNSNVIEIAKSAYGYTGLIFDRKNKRMFLTNEGGYLSIFNIYVFPHNLVTIIQTYNSNYIRGLDIDYNKQYIFTGNNKGNISIFNLDMPKKRKLIKEISNFGGEECSKIRVLKYNSEKNELYSGDPKGIITVWSLENKKSIYSWKAHYGPITKLIYDRKKNILISMGKDKKISYWEIPNSWFN